jgi:protein ImuB
VLDISGTERLYKGEENLCRNLFKKLSQGSIDAKMAVADTIGAAWALSRYAPPRLTIVRDEPLKRVLAPFPIESLRIPYTLASSLHQVGVHKIGELLALPRRSIPTRFGTELLRRIDLALGILQETVTAVQLPPSFTAKRSFEVPLIRHEPILKAISLLIEKVVSQVSKEGRKASRYIVLLQGRDGDGNQFEKRKEFSLHSATQRTSHLLSLLMPLLESLKLPGSVTHMEVTALELQSILPQQQGLFENEEPRALPEELLNTFVMRLGRDRVNRVHLHRSYLPERSYSFRPLEQEAAASRSFHLLDDRPSYLFHSPKEVKVLAIPEDGHPSRLFWEGKEYRILRGTGPERIGAEWWHAPLDEETRERDYFKIQDDTGRWLWLFRASPSGRWFVQGVWA